MKKTRKGKLRLLFLILTLVLVVGLGSTGIFAATDEVWVNGENITTDADNTVVCGEGTAVYDTATATLTLTDAEITKAKDACGINVVGLPETLKIVLEGKNSITTNDTTEINKGIYSFKKVEISGKGSLDITVKVISLSSIPCGIYAWEGFTVKDATITAKNTTAAEFNKTSAGIDVNEPNSKVSTKNATLSSDGFAMAINVPSGDVTINNSKLTVKNANRGISGGNEIDNFKIIDSTLDCAVTGENALGLLNGHEILIENSKVTLSSETSNAIYTDTGITIKKGSNLDVTGYYPTLYSVDDTVIEDSTVKATSTADSAIYTEGNIIIDGTSDITAKGHYAALNADGNITVNQGKVNATSTKEMGIELRGVLTVNAGEVFAKGAEKKAAIGALYTKQSSDTEPSAKIIINENYADVNGAKISASDWFNSTTGNTTAQQSWTSLIAKDDKNKLATDRSNAVNEVTIKVKAADYAKVDAAIDKIPTDLTLYTDATAKAVTDAKNAVVRDKNITEQAVVDGYATAIDKAVKALELKPVNKFPDVPKDNWAEKSINNLVALNIISGYPDGNFYPQKDITRAELCVILEKAAGDPIHKTKDDKIDAAFPDTKGHWGNAYIAWAKETGLVVGYPGGNFGPDDKISREEAALVLCNYAEKIAEKDFPQVETAIEFKDMEKISSWAKDQIVILQRADIINGYPDGTVAPQGKTKRNAAALMIDKILTLLK